MIRHSVRIPHGGGCLCRSSKTYHKGPLMLPLMHPCLYIRRQWARVIHFISFAPLPTRGNSPPHPMRRLWPRFGLGFYDNDETNHLSIYTLYLQYNCERCIRRFVLR